MYGWSCSASWRSRRRRETTESGAPPIRIRVYVDSTTRLHTRGMTALTDSPPAGAPAQLDAAAAQALERGETVRVAYASGYTHRLRLEEPRLFPAAPGSLQDLLRDLARRPADVLAARPRRCEMLALLRTRADKKLCRGAAPPKNAAQTRCHAGENARRARIFARFQRLPARMYPSHARHGGFPHARKKGHAPTGAVPARLSKHLPHGGAVAATSTSQSR